MVFFWHVGTGQRKTHPSASSQMRILGIALYSASSPYLAFANVLVLIWYCEQKLILRIYDRTTVILELILSAAA